MHTDRPMPTRRERWAALGILLLCMALAYVLLVHPWFTVPLLQAQADLDATRERGRRVQAQLAQAPEVEARLREAQQRSGGHSGFLPETSAELATADLVQRLESVVVQASPGNRSCAISDRAPQPVQPPTAEPYARVGVQVHLRCGTPELVRVLEALEQGAGQTDAPQLFVDDFTVLAQRYASEGGLDVSFVLYGYLRPDAMAAGGRDAS